ncbi:MAG TPA: maleylpyruvate isomerase family mycothiol-dependent enzyme [Acidimicrobiia bacterium]|nr:maleylpyruvate isomerase family mycothiol-dependent enzyme [Acidimicrobiia bacterium]
MSSTTQISDWLEAVRSNAALLADAVRTAGPAAPVPTCPEWTAADLLAHISRVHRWVTEIVESKAQERVGRSNLPEPGEGDDPVEWFEAGAAVVVTALETIDPDTPVWTWASAAPVPVRFWVRRMAHETAIHRVDAESAAGRAGPVEPAGLAVDGIDELLELLTVRIGPDDPLAGLTGSYHFHTTDVPGEWVVVFGTDGVHVAREHAKADVAIRGAASDLELFLYNRRGSDGLEVFGDPAQVAAWTSTIRF